ncbi:radical SAM protein [Desulfurococcaceae archaeon MEX13E-LK6-19]|nr:radical SAM protein [Desulfurococcaceae archaeon MEX13E-LK6-19]
MTSLVKGHKIYGNIRKLKVIRPFDPWRSPLCTCRPKYSLQPYTGCSHFCLYCYATSYIGRKPSTPKKMLLRNVTHDIAFINRELVVEMSSSSDPYPPIEKWLLLTRKVLEIFYKYSVKTLITTKSDLVTRDADLLSKIPAAVMITITGLDDSLARRLEPYAPPYTKRLEAIRVLSNRNIPVGVRIDPIIPGLNDDPEMLRELVHRVKEYGGKHIVTSTYKARPDNIKRLIEEFPDMASYWRRLYLEKGTRIHGYYYLNQELRKQLLKPVVEAAREAGLSHAVCREGFLEPTYFNAESCDGTHLIPKQHTQDISRVKKLF